MSTRRWFGTDGIRGEYGREPMTPAFTYRVGVAAGRYFKSGDGAARFVVGRDTRNSGRALEAALMAGIQSGGGQVRAIGVLPTAAVALVAQSMEAEAGIMISASHNPHGDNGIKFFSGLGSKLPDEVEEEIERLLDQISPVSDTGMISEKAGFSFEEKAYEIYASKLKASLVPGTGFRGLKIFIDTANGAAWQSSPRLLAELGAEVETIEARPDGKNINEGCGSQHPEKLQTKVKAARGAVGLAHDGDADRLVLIDETGEILDGDELLAIGAKALQGKRQLKKNCLVATVMSNLGLEEAMATYGIQVLRSGVGDRYVLEMMREHGVCFGGEQSGHMLFLDHAPTGDGLLSALQIFQEMRETGKPLCELRRILQKYPQYLVNVSVKEKLSLEEMPEVRKALGEVEAHLGFTGRAFLRYSGTENKVRLLLESKDGRDFEILAQKILRPLRDRIGV